MIDDIDHLDNHKDGERRMEIKRTKRLPFLSVPLKRAERVGCAGHTKRRRVLGGPRFGRQKRGRVLVASDVENKGCEESRREKSKGLCVFLEQRAY